MSFALRALCETRLSLYESEPDGAVDPALIASGGDGRDSRRGASGPRRPPEKFSCKEFCLQRTLAAKNFVYKESLLQVAVILVLTSLLDRNDSYILLEGLILRVGIDPYCHDKTARRAAAGPSAPAVDAGVLVVVLDDPQASIDVADGGASRPTGGDVCSKTVAIKSRGSGHHVVVRLLFQVDPSELRRLLVGREDIGPDRDGSLGERVSGGLPFALVEGLDSSQDGKANDHGRENQKEKLLLAHVSGSSSQKAAASKGRCSEMLVPRKADSDPHLQDPQDPRSPTGPTP